MQKSITLVSFLALSLSAAAQDSISMITNRPGYTEASRAVFKGGLQFELGLQYAHDPRWKNSADYYEYLTVPNLGILYGVTENIELRAFGVVTHERYSWQPQKETAFSDFSLGTKINVARQNGWIPEMAVLVTQTLPVSQANSSHKLYTTGALLALSYSTNTPWSIAGNIGYAIDWTAPSSTIESPHHLNYTVNLGYSWVSNAGVFAELSSFNNLENGQAFYQDVEGGGWYRFNPKFQIDAHAGYTAQNQGFYVEIGGSLLLLK